VNIYTGVWTNWSHGAIHGRTLTITQQYGGILAAFLALYVSFAGGMFWKILSFAIHQIQTRNHSGTGDWLRYEREVILRNSGTGSGEAAWSFFLLPFTSLGPRSRSMLRCLPYAFIAFTTLLLFSIAGIFTSAITKAPGNSTLIVGSSCGTFIINETSVANSPSYFAKILGDTVQAATYVRQCYQNDTSNLNCGSYVRPNIPFSVNQNDSCPFESGICWMGDTAAFSMDTGLMNSHLDFGINAAPKDRVLFRRKATCAPIHTIPFATFANTTLGNTLYINAGPAQGLNYTLSYLTHAQFDGIGYQLR
jgi:hypothetical protein